MLSNTSQDFISDMEVIDYRQKNSKKIARNRSVFSLEPYMKQDSNFRIMLYRRLNLP